MRSLWKWYAVTSAIIIISTTVILAAQQPGAPSSIGASLYVSHCSGCHMPDLGGRNEAPPLAGTNFMTTWRSRSTQELLQTMRTTMHPGRPNSLTADEYRNIAAFVLASNGAVETALTFSANIP